MSPKELFEAMQRADRAIVNAGLVGWREDGTFGPIPSDIKEIDYAEQTRLAAQVQAWWTETRAMGRQPYKRFGGKRK